MPLPGAVAVLAWASLALGIAQPVDANPIESSVWIDVVRDTGAVFKGYRLPREAEGMGVVVQQRVIATAAHVVWRAKAIAAIDARGTRVAARIERIDPDADVALLRVDARLTHVAPIRLRPAATSEQVVAVGLRKAEERPNLLVGSVSAARWTSNGVAIPTMLTSIKGEKGMSGGGLFDASGELVGIVVRIDRTLAYLTALPVAALCTRLADCAKAR
jgi:S1-C subfamily serine protease